MCYRGVTGVLLGVILGVLLGVLPGCYWAVTGLLLVV